MHPLQTVIFQSKGAPMQARIAPIKGHMFTNTASQMPLKDIFIETGAVFREGWVE